MRVSKKSGFYVTAKFFVPFGDSKTDYSKIAAAYATMGKIQETNTLPDGFLETAKLIDVKAKQGSYDEAEPAGESQEGETQAETAGEVEAAEETGKRGRRAQSE